MSTYDRKREQAIKNLGGACVCCGEFCEIVLQVDHKNGDSPQDRLAKKSVYFIVSQLAEGRDLDRFQLLCANCHRIKTTYSMRFGRNLSLSELKKLRNDFLRKGLAKLPLILSKAFPADTIVNESNRSEA